MPDATANDRQRLFNLLVLFRWLSLLPPLFVAATAYAGGNPAPRFLWTYLIGLAATATISVFARQLNHRLAQQPLLLGVDLLLAAALITFSGGWASPFILYALTPLLIAAFFWSVRGAILATTLFLPLYLLAVVVAGRLTGEPPLWSQAVVAIVGMYLVSGVLGYASLLLSRLHAARRRLFDAHRDLRVLHDLTTTLQRATGVDEVQEQVLRAVTDNLGFDRAAVGVLLVPEDTALNWLCYERGGTAPYPVTPRASLMATEGRVAEAIAERRILRAYHSSSSADPAIEESFGIRDSLVLPVFWGVHIIGALIVALNDREDDGAHLRALDAIARQAGATLGLMVTRVRRAKESAVREERTRIALDLHDTISQSLFGLAYTLRGSLRLLDSDPAAIRPELEWAADTADRVRETIRQTINDMWTVELTAEQFESDLRTYAADVLQAAELPIVFDIRGDFGALSPPVRRSLYRVCQEGLTNIVRHAAATEARVCVDVEQGRARLVIRDDGRGFDLTAVPAREYDETHFGLRGIRERAEALSGSCEIYSRPEAGTSIVIDIPANAQPHHDGYTAGPAAAGDRVQGEDGGE